MMKEIYGTACPTINWLGQLLPEDIQSIRLAKMTYARSRNDDHNHSRKGLSSTDFDCKARGIPDVMSDHLGINASWKALFEILIHPWFGRVWIIQELWDLVSRRPEMWRGDKSLSTEVMLLAVHLVGGKTDLRRYVGTAYGFSPFYCSVCCHLSSQVSNDWESSHVEHDEIHERYVWKQPIYVIATLPSQASVQGTFQTLWTTLERCKMSLAKSD